MSRLQNEMMSKPRCLKCVGCAGDWVAAGAVGVIDQADTRNGTDEGIRMKRRNSLKVAADSSRGWRIERWRGESAGMNMELLQLSCV